ncbi:MAG: thiamine diphosphokinase [Chloroflexota bacterium]
MSNPILLVANGDIQNAEWLNSVLSREYTAIIGVDGGTNHLLDHHVTPDIVVGDLDSLNKEAIKILEENWVNIFSFSGNKDETDLELALLYFANQPNWSELSAVILGAHGGRLDHEIANLMLLTHPKLQNRKIQLINEHETTFLVTSSVDIHGRSGDTVSLIPLKGDAHMESTTNLKWPLNNSVLKFGPARGVSNIMTASKAAVSVRSGMVLCIHTESSWER